MRQYAWYSPEFDVIVFQLIMEDCYIPFEWASLDAHQVASVLGFGEEPMQKILWMPLGEL